MVNSPIAMPYPYGYVKKKTLAELLEQWDEDKMSEDLFGMEDCGDSLSKQVGGTHYKKGVQPWTIALDWGLDPWSHNVVKYILRFPYKGQREDLEKIKHYLDFLLENYDEVVDKYYKK